MKRNRKSSPENLPPMNLFRNPKKRKKIFPSLKSPQQLVQEETCSYLPDDCWEIVFRFLIINDNNRHHCLNYLSLVSKQFLSVTSGLLFSLTILDQTRPFIGRLFKRFTHLISLNISRYKRNLNKLLREISCLPLNITSLIIYRNQTLLKQLNLGKSLSNNRTNAIQSLLSKFRSLQHLNIQRNYLNDQHVAKLSLFLGDLVSINLSHCSDLTELSLSILVRNCPSLSEIKMEYTSIGQERLENNGYFRDIGVYPQLKSLYLGDNSWSSVEKIIMFGSSFPNLEILDLNHCDLSDSISQVVSKFYIITHLNLAGCENADIFEMNFVVPKLEVLDLSDTDVDDETLYAIPKSCPGLLKLSLIDCFWVTEKGVKDVVENCKQLREIEFSDLYVDDAITELTMDAFFASVLKFV